VRDSGAPRAGAGEGRGTAVLRSVQEALAGFFPPAGRAPLVPVLDAVHLTALLGFTADFPAKGRKEQIFIRSSQNFGHVPKGKAP